MLIKNLPHYNVAHSNVYLVVILKVVHGQCNRINIDWLTQMYIWWLFGMLFMVNTTASILIGSPKCIFGGCLECCLWSIQPHQY